MLHIPIRCLIYRHGWKPSKTTICVDMEQTINQNEVRNMAYYRSGELRDARLMGLIRHKFTRHWLLFADCPATVVPLGCYSSLNEHGLGVRCKRVGCSRQLNIKRNTIRSRMPFTEKTIVPKNIVENSNGTDLGSIPTDIVWAKAFA